MIDFIKKNGPKKFEYNYEIEIINQKTPITWLEKNFKYKIGIIGIRYVGLPLAINFSKYFKVFGYDKDLNRIKNLNKGIDKNLDFKSTRLKSKKLFFTNDYSDLRKCNVYIITLPTPVDKKPDLSLIINATKKLAGILKKRFGNL